MCICVCEREREWLDRKQQQIYTHHPTLFVDPLPCRWNEEFTDEALFKRFLLAGAPAPSPPLPAPGDNLSTSVQGLWMRKRGCGFWHSVPLLT